MWSWSSSDPPKSYLKVYAATSYDQADWKAIPVNQSDPSFSSDPNRYHPKLLSLESELISAKVAVCIQDFQQPATDPPDNTNSTELVSSTSPYFAHPLHVSDKLSIQLCLSFKRHEANEPFIRGDELLWGNDFDKPIRDQLPYGAGLGVRILQSTVDPSVEGDIYADVPYLYGAALTSFNKICVGNATPAAGLVWPGIIEEDDLRGAAVPKVVQEGSQETDKTADQKATPIPTTSTARSRHFLDESRRHSFCFALAPAQYSFDFYTPYLDLGRDFAINLPGFKLSVERYGNGQPLRYTLKNKRSGKVYLVVVFELHKLDEKSQLNELHKLDETSQ